MADALEGEHTQLGLNLDFARWSSILPGLPARGCGRQSERPPWRSLRPLDGSADKGAEKARTSHGWAKVPRWVDGGAIERRIPAGAVD